MAKLTSEQIQALWDGPAAAPPVGAISNLQHPETLEESLLAVATFSLLIATALILIRLWTKFKVSHEWFLEDCMRTKLFLSCLGSKISLTV